MLNISKQSDYALLFISYLYDKRDEYVSLSELVSKTKMPRRFLARIAAKLAKNNIVLSKEGKTGGYKINKKIKDISLYDFLMIFEENLYFSKCSKTKYQCPWDNICTHKNFLKNTLYKIVAQELKKWKITSLFRN